jgi:hypothetical protein
MKRTERREKDEKGIAANKEKHYEKNDHFAGRFRQHVCPGGGA